MNTPKVGDNIQIDYMEGEPQYCGRKGVVRSIDDMSQVHGSWGGLALRPQDGDIWHIYIPEDEE